VPTIDPKHDGKLSTLVATWGLADPLASLHRSRPFQPSNIRGKDRIDFILVSKNILPAVTSTGSLPFHSLFNSDHWLCFIDFDSNTLFSDPAYELLASS
jgi:hypothetical protein